MLPQLSANHEPYFNIAAGFPLAYKGPVLPGASVITASAQEGTIVVQSLYEGMINIEFSCYHFRKAIQLSFHSGHQLLNTSISLKNSLFIQINDKKNIRLRQGHIALLPYTGKAYACLFEKEKEYQLFNIGYPEAIIEEIAAGSSPAFAHFFKTWKDEKSNTWTKSSWASRELIDIVHAFLKAPYEGSLRNYFYAQKIREFLFQLYVQHTRGAVPQNIMDSVTQKKIKSIAQLLKTTFTQYFPVPELARRVNMTESRLQTLFKQLYGKRVFEYHREKRLEEARRLILEEALQIKTIFSRVGYRSLSAFITEFKKKYGYPPGSLQKQKPDS